MAELTVKVDMREFKAWIEKLENENQKLLSRLMDESSIIVQELIRQNSPVRTGALRDSITIERTSVDTVIVGPTAPYAPFVEFGVAAHEIVPVRAEALRFTIDGETVFAKRVMHPGFEGRAFIKQSSEEAIPRLRESAFKICRELFGV